MRRRRDYTAAALWLALVIGFAVIWRATSPATVVVQQPVLGAPQVVEQTVVYVWTPTPTSTTVVATRTTTPWVVTATPKPTSTMPVCRYADEGDVCREMAVTATPDPIPACAAVTPVVYGEQTCRKGDGATSGKDQTE